ncbi:MAG TPA: NIPSNAP family containing protein [Mucilaginibacter sp.]|nr:NIPSNAP family containing protein [Mucilaginibacter sp.]
MRSFTNKTTFFSIGLLLFLLNFSLVSFANAADKYYYQLKIYHLKTKVQEERLDNYLEHAYLPALHRAGVKNVGVFKPVELDTADKRVYVLIPYKSLSQLEATDQKVFSDAQFGADGKDYLDAAYNDVPYSRIETIVLRAFPKMLSPAVPKLTGKKADRVYELRSYEGPTEKYYISKVKMFNDGNEVGLFTKNNFNAVFYAEVLAGSRMPNLMYMTTFNNKQDRDKHWDAFSKSAEWKSLSSAPEYQNNISKADIMFLYPTEYSDF